MSKELLVPPIENVPQKGKKYRHFKSEENRYDIVGIVYNTVTEDWDVLYKALYNTGADMFTRSLKNWSEYIDRENFRFYE